MSRIDDVLQQLGVPPACFHGRVALITGGASGIGEAVACVLAQLGAAVAIVDVSETGAAIAERLGAAGGTVRFYRCDVAVVADLERTVTAVEETLGPVDIVLHAAVTACIAPVGETSLATWDRIHGVVARAQFHLLAQTLPAMVARRRGTVLAVTSLETVPFSVAFNTAKASQRVLLQTVAHELGPDAGVSVFCVLPGVVDTPGFRELLLPGIARVFGVSTSEALQRMAHNPGYEGLIPPDDCAATIAYLIAHASEYHGQVADLIEPLARHGVIVPPADWRAPATVGAPEFLRAFQEVTAQNEQLQRRIELRTRDLAEAHARSEALLLNILPESIATRLKAGESGLAESFDEATVLFADLVGFTTLAARLPPTRLVQVLDAAFSAFDDISRRAGLEKIKTIGDCYMLVGGLPEPREDHVAAVAQAGLDFLTALAAVARAQDVDLACRIGIHTGPVVAGVIGRHKFAYDLWGDTVNTASRMESHGVPGAIHCSDAVHARLAGRFRFEERGVVDVKGKGPMHTWFLTGRVDRP